MNDTVENARAVSLLFGGSTVADRLADRRFCIFSEFLAIIFYLEDHKSAHSYHVLCVSPFELKGNPTSGIYGEHEASRSVSWSDSSKRTNPLQD